MSQRAHLAQAVVIAHACHGHTFQLRDGLYVSDSRLLVSGNPVTIYLFILRS